MHLILQPFLSPVTQPSLCKQPSLPAKVFGRYTGEAKDRAQQPTERLQDGSLRSSSVCASREQGSPHHRRDMLPSFMQHRRLYSSIYTHIDWTARGRAECHSISHFPDNAREENAEGGCIVQGLGCWVATWAASGLTASLIPRWSARPILRRIMIGRPSDTPHNMM